MEEHWAEPSYGTEEEEEEEYYSYSPRETFYNDTTDYVALAKEVLEETAYVEEILDNIMNS